MNHNQVELCGFVGNIRAYDGAKDKQPFASASLATHYRFSNKAGEMKEKTAWHNLVFFGSRAVEAKKEISKGTQLFIIGQLDYQVDTDSNGQECTKTIIKVAKFFVLDHHKKVKAPAPTEEEVMCSNPDDTPF